MSFNIQRGIVTIAAVCAMVALQNGAGADEEPGKPHETGSPIGNTADVKSNVVTVDGAELLAQADRPTYEPSVPIVVNLTLKNISGKVLKVITSGTVRDYRIEVTDEKGIPLPLTRGDLEESHF